MGMETKPYNLQSPEAIAKEYGGNKMKIAQAAQIGLLDPTAAVLAGMFIDRMRSAQQQEQAPQMTVAQQVLSPQPSAGAGLGATPQAAQMAAAYPAEGAPPAIPGPSMPQQEPVMAADGGLMSLPVDDAMFQPSYNAGGIVAFADGGVASSGEPTDAADRKLQEYRQAGAEHQEKQRLRNQIIEQYGLKSGVLGPLTSQSGAEREAAQSIMSRIFQMSIPELRAVIEQGPRALSAEQSSYNSGGIVAFAAGSEGPIKASEAIAETQEEQDRKAFMDTARRLKAAGMDVLTLPGRGVAGAFESVVTRPLRALGVPVPYLPAEFYGGNASSMTPYYDAITRGTTAQPPAVKPDAKLPDTATKIPDGAGAAGIGAPSAPAIGLPAAPKVGSARAAAEQITEEHAKQSKDLLQNFVGSLDQNRLQGKAFEGYEKQLREEAEAAGAEKEDAKNMALFKAGLAIMSGTSPNAFENIGKGALAGAADYQAAFKDLKKAERERIKQSALIEQARRAEEEGKIKRRDLFNVYAFQAGQAGIDFGKKALIEAGIKDQDRAHELAKTMLSGQIQLQVAERNAQSRSLTDGFSPQYISQVRAKAAEKVDRLAIRAAVAGKGNTPPKPGDDTNFDSRAEDEYRAAVEREVAYILQGMPSPVKSNDGYTKLPPRN
jgi:hypothetical protein